MAYKPKKKAPKKLGASFYKKESIEIAKYLTRQKGRCERCGTTQGLQGSHILSIGSHPNMAANLNNIICLCWGCHLGSRGWHREPIESVKWLESKYPGLYESLILESNTKPKVNWEDIYNELKNRL